MPVVCSHTTFWALGFVLTSTIASIVSNAQEVASEEVADSALVSDDVCAESQEEGDCSMSLRQLRLRKQTQESSEDDDMDMDAAAVPCAVPSESSLSETLTLAEINAQREKSGESSGSTDQYEHAEENEENEATSGCFRTSWYYREASGSITMQGTARSTASSADDCQSKCSSTPGCGFFSYWSDGGCLLTSTSAHPLYHTGVVSGPVSCAPSTPSYSAPTARTVRKRGGLEPPKLSTTYSGVAWETMKIPQKSEYHIFAIGDWGGLVGTGSGRMIQYSGGQSPGPHTMARWRGACNTKTMGSCFGGGKCPDSCHYTTDIDYRAQLHVADAMKKRAAVNHPDFFLNVGDNFYWGGINMKCGNPMHNIHPITAHQFNVVFEQVYHGPGVDGKPWLSVLGNHDWGGFQFNKAWDQQIAYTWASDRWVMPAPYFMQRVEYPDFAAEFFMIDTNSMDSHPKHADPEHNICGAKHNPSGADCAATGGPKDLNACFKWMWDLWRDQQAWVEKHLKESTADWQVVVTHFQCGHQAQWYKKLHQEYGLDLLVTGHTHTQSIFHNWKVLGGLTCFITGGGGGITSENPPEVPHSTAYGFYDLVISKDELRIESINFRGETVGRATIAPTNKTAA